MIVATDIHAAFGLAGVSLTTRPGITALVGPNGSGKTTLLRALAGLQPLTAGQVLIDGASPTAKARARAVAYLAQTPVFDAQLTVRRTVALGRIPHLGWLGRLSDADAAQVTEAMARTRTAQFANRPMGELSGGQRARVLLARALAVGAPHLLVDEPTAALDPAFRLEVMDILAAEAARGTHVVIALHELGLAHAYSDILHVMRGGRVVARDLSDGVLAEVFGIIPPPGGLAAPRRIPPA